jgi:hypothetical protein
MLNISPSILGLESEILISSSGSDRSTFNFLSWAILVFLILLVGGAAAFIYLAFNSIWITVLATLLLGYSLTNIVRLIFLTIQIPIANEYPINLKSWKLFFRFSNIIRLCFTALISQFVVLFFFLVLNYSEVVENNNIHNQELIRKETTQISRQLQYEILKAEKEAFNLQQMLDERLLNIPKSHPLYQSENQKLQIKFQNIRDLRSSFQETLKKQIDIYSNEISSKISLNETINLILKSSLTKRIEFIVLCYVLLLIWIRTTINIKHRFTYPRKAFEVYRGEIIQNYEATLDCLNKHRHRFSRAPLNIIYTDPPFNTQLKNNYQPLQLLKIEELHGQESNK